MNFGIAKIFNAVDKTIQDKFNYLIDLLSKFSADLDVSLTPSEILTKILTVDGTGSTLDADLLDGVHGSGYLSSSYTGVATDSDPDTTTLTYIVSNHSNTPSTSYYWHILTIKYTALYQKQIATGIQNDRVYTRFNYMGTWQPWIQLMNTNGGSVVPFAAMPYVGTAPIVEKGTGYVKYADGTLICYMISGSFTTPNAVGNIFYSNDITFTWPAEFNAAPKIFGSASGASGIVFGARMNSSPSTTASGACYMTGASSTAAGYLSVLAIGTWK